MSREIFLIVTGYVLAGTVTALAAMRFGVPDPEDDVDVILVGAGAFLLWPLLAVALAVVVAAGTVPCMLFYLLRKRWPWQDSPRDPS